MKINKILINISIFILSGCFCNSYYFIRNSQVYDDSSCEIRILYENIGKEYLRVYYIPKNMDSCNEYLVGMNAKLKIKMKDTSIYLNFKSKSDTSMYKLPNGNIVGIGNRNDVFGTYYSSECCGCKSWFSHCGANLYYSDNLNLYKIHISKNDTIWYDISGKLLSHGKLIDINKNGIMHEGNIYGKSKPKNF